ncbi:MAG: hypothetical protein ACYCPF_00820 [Streptosporangiaceae bacterium]
MLAVLMVALLALAGLVIDGGRKLEQAGRAVAVAQAAAPARAGMADRTVAYRSGTIVVSQARAIAAARAYLAASGCAGTVQADGASRIRVTVALTTPTVVLSLVGIDTLTSTATAVAVLVGGVAGPGR